MSISLQKGQRINLTKDNENLTKIRIGLGWDEAGAKKKNFTKEETKPKKQGFLNTLGSVLKGEARIGDVVNSAVDGTRGVINNIVDDIPSTYRDDYPSSTTNIDIDASVIMLNENGRFSGDRNLIYFGNLQHSSGAVRHSGDNLTGKGSGDDEVIYVDLSRVPNDISKLIFIVNIYSCRSRHQHFGMIQNAYIKAYDDNTNKVLCQYDLTEDYDGSTAIYVAELYRYNNEWKFGALGEASKAESISDMVKLYR